MERAREARIPPRRDLLQYGSLTYSQFTSDYYALYTYAAFLFLPFSPLPRRVCLPFLSSIISHIRNSASMIPRTGTAAGASIYRARDRYDLRTLCALRSGPCGSLLERSFDSGVRERSLLCVILTPPRELKERGEF